MERKPHNQSKTNWVYQLLDSWEYTVDDPAMLKKNEREAVDIGRDELQDDWAIVSAKTVGHRRYNSISVKPIWLRYAAVLLPLLAGLTLLFFFLRQEPDHRSLHAKYDTLQSSDARSQEERHLGPFIILDDGTKISLTDDSQDLLGDHIAVAENELRYLGGQPEDEKVAASYNTIVIPKGMDYKLKLADGTQVWLNANTVLKYMVDFNGQAVRQVYLEKGEAYFAVAKDVNRPFMVHRGGFSVKVLGTEFNINTYANKIQTTLLEGKVAIQVGESKVELLPNDQVNYIEANQSVEKSIVNASRFGSWRNGLFEFEDDKLDVIMEVLANYYDVNVTFKDRVLGQLHFKGTFDKKDKLSDILRMIQRTTDIRFRINGKEVFVEK